MIPYARCITWLLTEGKTEDEIRRQMDEITLPVPELDMALLPLSRGTGRRLKQKLHSAEDEAFFEKLGYGEVYLKSVGKASPLWDEVSRILRNPVVRIAIDCGIICKYSVKELAQLIPPAMNESLSEGGIDLYLKYFFDVSSMSKTDWRAFLELCLDIPYAYSRYFAALTKSREEASHLAGIPAATTFAYFLKGVLATAQYKFQYYSRQTTQYANEQARAWAKTGFEAGVRYEKFAAGDIRDFAAAVQTSFEYEDTDIPLIDSEMLSQVKPPEELTLANANPPAVRTPAPDPENY
jgi:hypothetical protein